MFERATRFIAEALWERWEEERLERERAGAPAAPRVSQSRRDLFRDCTAILRADPSSQEAQAIVARWRAIVEAEPGETRKSNAHGRGVLRTPAMAIWDASLHGLAV